MKWLTFSIALFVALAGFSANAAAENVVYLSISQDRPFCQMITLGDDPVTGEYSITFVDPEFPDRPWVDTHSVRFVAGPGNPIVVPVCFSADGRPKGTRVFLDFTLSSPLANKTAKYGICVSDFEDIEFSTVVGDPCRESYKTDIFSFDMLLSKVYASPGESIHASLYLSSDLTLDIILDKKSGPPIDIPTTRVSLPGDQKIDISITAPGSPGDYPFEITATAEGCLYDICEKSVAGTIYVSDDKPGAFTIDLAPKNRNVIGTESVKYYLSITNEGEAQPFKINVQSGIGIESDTSLLTLNVGKGMTRTEDFWITPKERDHKVHTIRVTVENEGGVKRVADAWLTVDEALSDAGRAEENDDITDEELDEFEEDYEESGGLETLEFVEHEEEPGGTPEETSPLGIYIIIAVAVGVVAVVAFYIYKKSVVTGELESGYFEGSYLLKDV